jgi:hypothetical protein
MGITGEYGEVMTFLVGIDVQRTLQERDPPCARKCGS